jgi:hypothetical protein
MKEVAWYYIRGNVGLHGLEAGNQGNYLTETPSQHGQNC